VGETLELLPVLRGLGRFYVVRGEFQTARDVGRHLLAVAEVRRDAALLVMAHNALGVACLYAGDFEAALEHLERGLERYDSERHSPTGSPVFRLVPPGITCAIHAAWALWMLGYPERAAARSQEALALARSLDDPFSLSYACHLAAALHHWRREHDLVRALEDEALTHDTEHGFGLLLASGVMHRGWLLAEEGRIDDGLARTLEGLARYREIGAAMAVPPFLGLVAEMHDKVARHAEARSAITEAMNAAQKSGQHYWEAELHRLTAVLMLQGEPNPSSDVMAAAESSLRRAIEVARRQRAKWLELRAVVSLSRLWADHGDVARARALLSEIYASFTEGFDTADLREAKSLLETLKTP
jgi:adenylate cyclase